MELYFVMGMICAVLGYVIAPEGKKWLGALLGCVFGVFGLIISAVLKSE